LATVYCKFLFTHFSNLLVGSNKLIICIRMLGSI